MGVARVRVELKPMGSSFYDREKAFRVMHTEFKRRVGDAGILHELKERQYFESKSETGRKKLRIAIARRKQDEMEARMARGERIQGDQKMVRRILNKNKKKSGSRRPR